jgi:hypothetical protein
MGGFALTTGVCLLAVCATVEHYDKSSDWVNRLLYSGLVSIFLGIAILVY